MDKFNENQLNINIEELKKEINTNISNLSTIFLKKQNFFIFIKEFLIKFFLSFFINLIITIIILSQLEILFSDFSDFFDTKISMYIFPITLLIDIIITSFLIYCSAYDNAFFDIRETSLSWLNCYKYYYTESITKENELKQKENEIKQEESNLNKEKNEIENKILKDIATYPWLSRIYADYKCIINDKDSIYLKNKSKPALKASENLANLTREKKELIKQCKVLEYQLNYYETLFPWLENFKEVEAIETFNEINTISDYSDEYSKLKKWLSPIEYQKLSNIEKYQLALERYKNSAKTAWQIGIEYERYIGYLYESKGYKIIYNGALEGLNDLGRDIIAENDDRILVIQCKYWKKEKTIHEKHIFQLFGTVTLKKIETNKEVDGLFITTAKLSETAKKVANSLKIKALENKENKNYPCIKCNINKTTKEKIYHLPFDQQYDRITIDFSKGEKYVNTVKEAEDLGFRRAKKWIAK